MVRRILMLLYHTPCTAFHTPYTLYHVLRIMAVSMNWGVLFLGPVMLDHSILGSILGSPVVGNSETPILGSLGA